MSVIFGDTGIRVVPTGSLAICFRLEAPSEMPEEITLSVLEDGADPEEAQEIGPLPVISAAETAWKYLGLTPPLKFGVAYSVRVLFDGAEVHSETVEIPPHYGRKGSVLRQRLYELLLEGYQNGDLEAMPYGNGHCPGAVNEGDFKPEGGVIVEVGNYYTGSISLKDYRTRESQVTIPLNVHVPMDDESDAGAGSEAFEEIADYLMRVDWRLGGFGMFQSAATFEGNEPEVNEDRALAVMRGSLNVAMRKTITR